MSPERKRPFHPDDFPEGMTRASWRFRDWHRFRKEYEDYYDPLDRGIFDCIGPEMRARHSATPEDLSRIAFWKFGSWRHETKILSAWNRATVAPLSRRVFRMGKDDAEDQVRALTTEEDGLDGFGVPMASALLTVFDPQHYAVIDRYAWYAYAAARAGRRTIKSSFSNRDYVEYLAFCRDRGRGLEWSARDVEKALFAWGEAKVGGKA